MILHITSRAEWNEAQTRGEYIAPSLQTDVANAFYCGRNDLVLLKLNEAQLKPELKWEPPAGSPAPGISDSDKFPHIFGPINLTAVASVLDFEPDSAGMYILPPLA